ncbi:hypothetical protein [Sandaracinus amylolyticus]|uniref:Uncharacterized protein n=1 Tax=Sandaracinus amylolyticus TaxID=927083 RepID=A0A0F6YHQ0_9BACT|nr:hypothetical protein [Sandaracinus amylolyticus]AKF05310.1 hypothetical protein DB32_002459 [Sandaracinus amylolyticus]
MAKAAAARTPENQPVVEELHFKSESAFLCLLLNRRTGLIRVIDFRSGALPAKRLFIQNVARREGVEKVILLVEKDEVSSWTRVGFVREGTIPGFYKRSDGHLVGCVIGEKTASVEVGDEGQKLAERTVNAGKKNAREVPETLPMVSAVIGDEEDALKARDEVWRKGQGLSGFDAFGRDAARYFVEATAKKGRANWLSAEFQDCFGHSLVEVLRAPTDDLDVLALTGGLRFLCDDLKERGIVSAFGFAPSDDIGLATAYVAAGFRKTGLLASGIQIAGGGPKGTSERKDAILWTRKLANPGGDEE